jgi:hypothetical protein
MDSIARADRNRLLQERAYFMAIAKQKPPPAVQIGDRDAETGRYQAIVPDGATLNGIKTFDAQSGDREYVRAIATKQSVALDSKNARRSRRVSSTRLTEVAEASLHLVSHGTLSGYNPSGDVEFVVQLKTPPSSEAKIALVIESFGGANPCIFGTGVDADCYPLLYICHPIAYELRNENPLFAPYAALPPIPFVAGEQIEVTVPADKTELYLYLRVKDYLSPSGVLSRKPLSPRLRISLIESATVSVFEDPINEQFAVLEPYIVQVNVFTSVSFYDFNAIPNVDPSADTATLAYPFTDFAEYNDFIANPSGEKHQQQNFTDTQSIGTYSLNAIAGYEVTRPPDIYQLLYVNPQSDNSDPPVVISEPITIETETTTEFYSAAFDAGFDTFRNSGIVTDVTDLVTSSNDGLLQVYWVEAWTDVDLADLVSSRSFLALDSIPSYLYYADGVHNYFLSSWGIDGVFYFPFPPDLLLSYRTLFLSFDSGFEAQPNGWFRQKQGLSRIFPSNEKDYYNWNSLYDYTPDRLAVSIESEVLDNYAAYISVGIQFVPSHKNDYVYFLEYYEL